MTINYLNYKGSISCNLIWCLGYLAPVAYQGLEFISSDDHWKKDFFLKIFKNYVLTFLSSTKLLVN